MADKLKFGDFVLEYYKRLLFNKMPIEKFVQFCDLVDKDELTDLQKHWKDLLKKDEDGNLIKDANNLYIRESNIDLANEWDLDDDELKKLFQAVQNTLRSMSADKDSFKYDWKVKDFLNKYFGRTGRLFTSAQLDPQYNAEVDKLYNILQSTPQLKQTFSDFFTKYDLKYEDFVRDLGTKKYNSNPKFQNTFIEFVQTFNYYLDGARYDPTRSEELKALGLARVKSFQNYDKWFNEDNIDPQDLKTFRGRCTEILSSINAIPVVYDTFTQNESAPKTITKKLNEARKLLDYDNAESKAYVSEKEEDKDLTLGQQISDFFKDTYSDYLRKFVELRGDRVYFSSKTKLMVKAIDKLKIKPTDGLAKILSEKDKISKLLIGKYGSPDAKSHFEWFTKTIEQINVTHPKLVESALRNGHQMRKLAERVIIKAVQAGKINEAKSALELLSVIKYGLLTSRIMDKIAKDKLTLFSDKGLSWNKNDGMKFVTTAMDNTINYAIKTFGRIATMGVNAIRLNGSHLKGRTSNRFNTLADAADKKYETEYEAEKKKKEDADALNIADKKKAQEDIKASGLDEKSVETEQSKLDAIREKEKTLKENLENVGAKRKEYEYTRDQNTKIKELKFWIKHASNAADKQHYTNQLENLHNDIADEFGWDSFNDKLFSQKLSDAQRNLTATNKSFDTASKAYNDSLSKSNALEQRINQFKDGTERIKELEEQQAERDEAFSKWPKKNRNKYRELMAYWDFLETGRDSHMGKMYSWRIGSAKVAQKTFDEQKDDMFEQYLNNYQMAA